MKKNGRDELLERIGEKEEIIASKAKPSRKPLKTNAPSAPIKSEPFAPVRKRTIPLLGAGSIQIFDMRAVLK